MRLCCWSVSGEELRDWRRVEDTRNVKLCACAWGFFGETLQGPDKVSDALARAMVYFPFSTFLLPLSLLLVATVWSGVR